MPSNSDKEWRDQFHATPWLMEFNSNSMSVELDWNVILLAWRGSSLVFIKRCRRLAQDPCALGGGLRARVRVHCEDRDPRERRAREGAHGLL